MTVQRSAGSSSVSRRLVVESFRGIIIIIIFLPFEIRKKKKKNHESG